MVVGEHHLLHHRSSRDVVLKNFWEGCWYAVSDSVQLNCRPTEIPIGGFTKLICYMWNISILHYFLERSLVLYLRNNYRQKSTTLDVTLYCKISIPLQFVVVDSEGLSVKDTTGINFLTIPNMRWCWYNKHTSDC